MEKINYKRYNLVKGDAKKIMIALLYALKIIILVTFVISGLLSPLIGYVLKNEINTLLYLVQFFTLCLFPIIVMCEMLWWEDTLYAFKKAIYVIKNILSPKETIKSLEKEFKKYFPHRMECSLRKLNEFEYNVKVSLVENKVIIKNSNTYYNSEIDLDTMFFSSNHIPFIKKHKILKLKKELLITLSEFEERGIKLFDTGKKLAEIEKDLKNYRINKKTVIG